MIRVRHIPAAHPYVQHLLPPPGVAPEVLHVVDPPVPGAPPGQWWPHPALDPEWVRTHRAQQDVVHLHFGTEGRTPEQLRAWVDTLEVMGLPLVYTVHDLQHPHLADQGRHHAHLAVLVERAAGLLTLTEGAAAVLEKAHGRRPLVVPHPHLVPFAELVEPPAAPPAGTQLRVGLHLKSLRTNLAPTRVLPALVQAVGRVAQELPDGAVLEVRAHPDVLDATAPRHDPGLADLLERLSHAGPDHVVVTVAPRLSDDALRDYLRGLDVSVLAYAWGTHSGWVEECKDVGTWVLAPQVGHLSEQGGVLTWGDPRESPDERVLVDLLRRAAAAPAVPLSRDQRSRERQHVATLHAQTYRDVLAGRRVDAHTQREEQ